MVRVALPLRKARRGFSLADAGPPQKDEASAVARRGPGKRSRLLLWCPYHLGLVLELPFLVLLDEAAHIARMRNLAKLANTVSASNIQLVSIWHDMAQLRALYGQLADSVVNGHRAKLLLPGISDPDTLEYLSRLIGQAEYMRRSVSRGLGWGNVTTTDAGEFRDLAPVELLRQLPRGVAVLLLWQQAADLPAYAAVVPRSGPAGARSCQPRAVVAIAWRGHASESTQMMRPRRPCPNWGRAVVDERPITS